VATAISPEGRGGNTSRVGATLDFHTEREPTSPVTETGGDAGHLQLDTDWMASSFSNSSGGHCLDAVPGYSSPVWWTHASAAPAMHRGCLVFGSSRLGLFSG